MHAHQHQQQLEFENAACGQGNLARAKHILQANPDIDTHASDEYVFRHACKKGYLAIAKWMVEEVGDVRITSLEDCALKWAVMNNHCDIVEYILSLLPVPENGEFFGRLFRVACANGAVDVSKWLARARGQQQMHVRHYQEGFRAACGSGAQDLCTWLWTSHGPFEGAEAFCAVCERGRVEMVPWIMGTCLLTQVHCPLRIMTDALQAAAGPQSTGSVAVICEVLQVLKAMGKEIVGVPFLSGVWSRACRHGHLSLAKWLYEGKPWVQDISCMLFNGTIDACTSGHLHVMQWIVPMMSPPQFTAGLRSIFSTACHYGHLAIVEWLYSTFPVADLDMFQDDHKVFLDACVQGHVCITKWFADTMSHPYPSPDIERRGFRFACILGRCEVVKWFLRRDCHLLETWKSLLPPYKPVPPSVLEVIAGEQVKHSRWQRRQPWIRAVLLGTGI